VDAVFTPLWIAWLALFVVIEGVALVRKRRGDTLSENTWSWFCLRDNDGSTSCKVRRIAFIAFWVWLTIHLIFGGLIF